MPQQAPEQGAYSVSCNHNLPAGRSLPMLECACSPQSLRSSLVTSASPAIPIKRELQKHAWHEGKQADRS